MKTIKNIFIPTLMVLMISVIKINAQGLTACRGTHIDSHRDSITIHGGTAPYTWQMDSIYTDQNTFHQDTITKGQHFFTGISSVTQYIINNGTGNVINAGYPIYITDGIGDTLTIHNVTELQFPTATITSQNESSSLYCDGSIHTQLIGIGVIQSQWFDSNSNMLSTFDSIIHRCPGIYTLKLIDSIGCKNTYTQTIQAGPIPPTQPLCMVTVDQTNTHNLLVWEKSNLDPVVDSFIVYREITTNNYLRIGAVSKDSMSTFDDFLANPSTTGYRYKLLTKNAQNVESILSEYHNTVYLTHTGANFNWTPYQVENNTTPVASYDVYRDDNSTGSFNLIGNTTGNQFGYTDNQYSNFPNASYYVEASMSSGICNPTRNFTGARSNTNHIGTLGIQQLNKHSINVYPNPANDIIYVTLHDASLINNTTIEIYNAIGNLVLTQKSYSENTSIIINSLTKGIYTVRVISDNKQTVNRIIKN